MNYYNEYDPKAAAWLRELIRTGEIPEGHVDQRSILEISPHELTGYTQCHFFAGIGGWSLALKLAGWPATRPVWTGSCPCQPFSSAGAQKGKQDERHLWPAFFNLIRACRPQVIFGEQVASALVVGKVSGEHKEEDGPVWLDGISADLESADYATGSIILGAHSVGSPHRRQRLYWLADSTNIGHERSEDSTGTTGGDCTPHSSPNRELANTDGRNSCNGELQRSRKHGQQPESGCAGQLAYTQSGGQRIDWSTPRKAGHADERSTNYELEHSIGTRLEGHARNEIDGDQPGRIDTTQKRSASTPSSPWNSFDLIPCTDGKARIVEPGTFPLAHGIPARMVRLRGYGNAIVPQVAATFIKAYLEIT